MKTATLNISLNNFGDPYTYALAYYTIQSDE